MGNNARYDIGFIESETLVFPEITIHNAFANRFFEDSGGIEAVGSKRASIATFVEETLFIGAVGSHFRFLIIGKLRLEGMRVLIDS